MKILHIDLQERGSDRVEFRFFWDNPNQIQSYQRSLSEPERLTAKADTDYYTRLPEDYTKTGKALYNWLDGSERILQTEIDKHRREGIILAISTSQRLDHFPWELLHDDQGFLVSKLPAIIPLRWVKTGSERQLSLNDEPCDRPLNVLFMASSARGIEPELFFEDEEFKILKATRGKPLSLIVEESGCLQELCELVASKQRGYFDVIHLSGHATIEDGKPYFITETEYGDRQDTSAEDIARALPFDLPKLMFLSGCRTGYSSDKGILSMAEELVKLGANAVLAWGKPVKDNEAADAAAILYQKLANGFTLSESVASAYQSLLRNQARDWHCLRLYVTGSIPEALVTRGQRKPLPPVSVVNQFVDPETKYLRVADRETFVGRRRELQNCLQVLKKPFDNSIAVEKVGVFIQGMGGNGKSSIAARLCDRLPDHEKVVWWRQVDQTSLVNTLAKKLDRQQRQILIDSDEELEFRLREVFSQLNRPFLLILDDFEWNLDYRDDDYILKPEVAEILKSLVWAVKETSYYHRIIITCRYKFNSPLLDEFYPLPSLRSLQKSDLEKKLSRLDKFSSGTIEESYIQRALALADGNPRLLEWLNDEVLGSEDIDAQLTYHQNRSDEWKDKVIWKLEEAPKLQTDEALKRVVSRCLIYQIPVPLEALEAVCASIPNYKEKLEHAQGRGLIEVTPEERGERLYRASHIKHINPFIELPQDKESSNLSGIAAGVLTSLWGNKENKNEDRWREIFRLAFADKENPERFREQFFKMIEVQYNSKADSAYQKELRLHKDQLSFDHLFNNLAIYLEGGNWRKADLETAFIFYQLMIRLSYDDFYELFREVSLDVINEIDKLWMQHSGRKFGIRGQVKIYQSLGGADKYNEEIWEKINLIWENFCDRVGWRRGGEWLEVEQAEYTTMASDFHLPILMHHRFWSGFGVTDRFDAKGGVSSLAWRLK